MPRRSDSPIKRNAKGTEYRFIPNCQVSKLKPYDRNPRVTDAAVNEVMRSIQMFGFVSPIIVNESMQICAGHSRYKAAILLELKSVPVLVVHGLVGNRFKGYNVADNQTAQIAGWDYPELGRILAELEADSFDLQTLGFSDGDIKSILASMEEPDFSPITQSDQPRLDVTAPITCPNCGHQFHR